MRNLLSKKNAFLIALCLVSHFNYSQNLKIDSINNCLRNHVSMDTTRVNMLIEKATLFKDINIDSTYVYAIIGEQLANELEFSQGEAESLVLISDFYKKGHQFEEAEKFIKKALIIFEQNLSTDEILSCYRSLGIIAYEQFQYDRALLYFEKIVSILSKENQKELLINTLGLIAEIYDKQEDFVKAKESFVKILELAKEIEYQRAIIKALNSIASINSATNNYPEAIDDFNKALILAKEHNEIKIIPVLMHNIGVVYLRQGSYQESLEYLNKAFLQYKKNKDYQNIINCLNDFGSLYKAKKEFENALKYYKDALAISDEQRTTNISATIYNNIGHLYIFLGKYSESITYLKKGLVASIKIKSKERMYYSYLGLGKVYFNTQNYNVALTNALKGLQLIEEIKQVNHRNEIHELLANIYAKIGQYQKAYENQILFRKFTDSAFNLETTKNITQLEIEYKYREEKLLAKLKEEKLIIENKRTKESLVLVKNQKLWMIIGILVLIIVLVFVIMNHNVISLHLQTKNVLTEQKLLRSQMTPHFMFNSLSVLQGIILNKEYDKSLNYLSKFSSLLRLSLENSRATLVRIEKEITAIEKYLIVQNIARKIPFHYEILSENMPNQNELLVPPMMIQPFVENAIKHGFRELKDDQEIRIVFTYSQQNLTCNIMDNGVGIDALKNTFSRTNTSISTNLIKERLEILGKEFNINSGITIKDRKAINEIGTIVTINLPYKIQVNNESTNSRG